MRKYLIQAFLLAGIVLLIRNLHVVLMELPDDAAQGPIYRILFFHVPSFFAAGIGFAAVFVGSVMYLIKRDLRYDSFAASVNEISVIFWTIGTALGSLWGRVIWGIWWTWDARLTSVFVAWLMGVSYMILRTSIDEPNQRARRCSVLSILVTADLPIVWYSIEWFRTQHPAPVLRGSGSIDPAMKAAIYSNVLPLLLIGAALVLIRLRQEEMRREIDGLRRLVHAL